MPPESGADKAVDVSKDVALSDTIRVMIIAVLYLRPLSAAEIAERIGVPADKVRYHLRRLLTAGTIDAVGEEPRRGVVQRYYAGEKHVFFEEHYGGLGTAQKRHLNAGVLRLGFREAARALVGGVLRRSDHILARTELELDVEGWSELLAIHREAMQKVIELKERQVTKPASSGRKRIRATSLITCFEQDSQTSVEPS